MDHTIIHLRFPPTMWKNSKRLMSKFSAGKSSKHLGPIDYWIGQTVPVDANGMPLRPGINAGLYKSYFLRENL